MSRLCAGILVVLAGASAAQGVDFAVGTSTSVTWFGYMNVFERPANGGGYVFGSPWGVPDLVSLFNDGAHTLTLKPNSVNDPNAFWYLPAGGPGSTGNKTMEANTYVEITNQYAGETVTFSGTILSNTLATSHTAFAFIKDFAADYSSFVMTQAPLTTGSFSLTTIAEPGAGRHIQYGVMMIGPCVWITDVEPYGSVVIQTVTPPVACPADLDDGTATGTPDGGVDINDLLYFLAKYEAGDVAADLDDGSGTGTADGGVDINDLLFFLAHYEGGC